MTRPTPEDTEELEELVAMAAEMAKVRARVTGKVHREDDFVELAYNALAGGLRTWDPARGASKKTHVKRRISGELLDATKADRRRQGREVLLDDLAEPLGPGVEDDGAALALAAGVSALVFGPDEGLLDREKRAALRREVKCLPPPLERLAELRHFQGLPWRDVAKALGISEKTARNYDKKLRALLQVKLRDDDDLPFGP